MKKSIITIFLLGILKTYAQTYNMPASYTTYTTCSGDFYDSGGAGLTGASRAGNNEDRTVTFCPSTPGDKVQIIFTVFDLDNSFDFLYIFDGNSTAAPSLGVYTGVSGPGTVQATSTNTSGCVTIRFTSDAITRSGGWEGALSCFTPCQTINSVLNSSIPAPVGGVIKICQGQSVQFNGSGTFSSSGVGAVYTWDFGNGTSASGTSATATYTAPGAYKVNLNINVAGCTNNNSIGQVVQVSTTPSFSSSSSSSTICVGQSAIVTATAVPVPVNVNCTPPVSGTTYLPDGSGVSYSTCVNVNCFNSGQTITSVNDIQSICLNMEHSYSGDLDIAIQCPNGQSVSLKNYPGGSGTNLGEPYLNGLSDNLIGPGTGYNYCFSMSGTVLLVNAPTVSAPTSGPNGGVSQTSFSAGTYSPASSFSGLIGCPLNGNWCIKVTDHLSVNNGYIFNWDVNFDPSLTPSSLSFTPSISAQSWMPDASIVSSNSNSITVQPSTAGTYCYTYTATDDFNCSYSTTHCITAVSGASMSVSSNTSICQGTSVVLSASGASSYTWSSGANTASISVTPSASTVYTVIGGGAGCTDTKTISVSVVQNPTVAVSNATICAGSSTVLTASGATTYSWNTGATTPTISVSSAGIYTVTGTSNGCVNTRTVNLTVNTIPTTTASTTGTLTCTNLSVNLNSSLAGVSYTWSAPSGGSVASANSQTTTASGAPGTYTLFVQGAAGCTYSTTTSVSQNTTSPSGFSAGANQTLTCVSPSVTLTGIVGTPANATLSWLGANVCGSSTTIATSACGAGVYTLTATNPVNGCIQTSTVNVAPSAGSPSVTVTSTSQTITCTNTVAVLSVTTSASPVTYTWTGSGITSGVNSNSISVTQGGTFVYTVEASNGCKTSNNIVVSQNTSSPSVASSSTGSLNCLTTTVNASATTSTTPVSYTWAGSGITAGSNTGTIAVNQGGTYNYTVTNTDNNCVTSGSLAIVQDVTVPSVISSSTGSLNCLTTTVNVSATTSATPVSYTWSGAGILAGSGTGTIIVNQGGTYDYTVTNTDNNCSTTGSVTIAQDATVPSVVSSSTGSLNCLTTTVNVSATTTSTPVSYLWSGSGITAGSGTGTITVNQGGTYDYTVTNTDNGCVSSGSVAIIQDVNTPTVTVSGTQTITCASPTVTLIGSATPSTCIPVWTGGVTSGANSYTATTTSANVFTLTVTDPTNLCTSTATTEVVADAGFPSVTASASGSLSCLVGTVNVVATTTSSPVSYSWSGPGIVGTNASTATINQGGLYTVTVTNTSSSCESVITVSVTQNTAIPIVVVSPSQTLTCALPTLAVSSTVTPSGSYTYTWTGAGILSGTNTDAITVNTAGNYVLEITDALNGCTNTATAVVGSDANLPSASILATSTNTVITCNNTSVNLLADVIPVTSVYSYTWTTGANTPTISVNSASVVGVVVTNTLTGCSTAATITISNNTIVPSVSTSNSVIPCGTSSISLTSTASNVNYNWTTTNGNILSGANSASPSISSAGVYVLTVTDITNGCVNTATSNVTQTNINVAFTANPTSGTAPLIVTFSDQSSGVANYSWNFGDNNNNTSTSASPVHTYTTPGVYVVSLTGTDAALACSNTVTLTIEVLENTTIIIPNVFTPNGDGANDKFKIVTTGMKELTVDIFNRWGNKLYTIPSPSDSWDGSGASDGTYFFILKAKGYDGKDYNKEGYINLFR